MSDTNDQLLLISGVSGTGKSASLQNIKNQENWLYMNTEAGKTFAPLRRNMQSKLI